MTAVVVLLLLSRSSSFGANSVARWTFDDPNFLGQDSVGTNDAALFGDVSSWAGVHGEAVLLDGAGAYLSAPDSAALRFQGPMTVVAWAYANAVNANYPLVYKISDWDDGQMSYALDLDYNMGGHFPRFFVSSDGHGTGYKEVVSADAISPGQWYLIAAVYDGASLNLYVNGKLEGSLAHTAGIFPGTDPLYIGRNWNQTWDGAIDEVRLYDSALSAAEIQGLYQDEAPTLSSPVSSSFGRVPVGESVTNQVLLVNTGTNDLTVGSIQITGPDATNFQVVGAQSGFVLPAGASNVVLVEFTPDAVRSFSAELNVTNSANSVQIALSGQGFSSGPANAVAWWTFDDTNFPGEDSVGTNDATLLGNASLWAGVHGEAVLLDGAGAYLSVADSPALRFQGPMTVVVWAYANAVNANYPLVYKISDWDDGQMSYALDLDYNTGGYYPRFFVSSDGHGTGYDEVASTNAISPGQWYLIGAVYDGASLNLYVNGKLENSVAHTAGIFPGTDPLYIGRNWNQTWNGAIDEVRLYDGALSGSEIQSIYQNEAPTLTGPASSRFGRAGVGQSVINQVLLVNTGPTNLTVGPIQITGPDATNFQVVAGQSGFVLPAGASNVVLVEFMPDTVRTFTAELTATSSANGVEIALSGVGLASRPISKPFTLELESIDDSGQLNHQQQTFQGGQTAVIVTDTWNSHPDPEMTSRTCGIVQRMNQALDAARDLGITVIFSPSDCLGDFDGTPLRAGIVDWPAVPQGDNLFSPPLPPYADSGWGDMVPPNKSVPQNPQWSHQHPDLVVKSNDLASLSRDEIYNYCANNGITNLLYAGTAANMCVCDTREFSMVPMRRYCNFQPIMFRDLTDSMTLNGRSPADYSVLDLTMTPDRGHREAVAFNERYVCSTTDAAQLMRQWVPGTYTFLIATESNLLCYWRLDSKAGYRDELDVKRVQSCWWYQQTNSFNFQVPGAIANDPDTALGFTGGSTILVSPAYRDDIPTNSPLVSLSATNFSIEAWIQPNALNSNQWCFAHDDGTASGVDVLFGISSSNRFRMVVGRNAQGSGWGCVVDSAVVITPADVSSGRWYHVVATRDAIHGLVQMYIDGNLDSQAPDMCQPVSLSLAPHLGSRGLVGVDGNGVLTNAGFEFFSGALDEMAIYSGPLGADAIASHHSIGQGAYAGLLTLSAQKTIDNQIQLSWSAWPPGIQLQATDAVLPAGWDDVALPVNQSNSLNQVTVPCGGTNQFFRLRSP